MLDNKMMKGTFIMTIGVFFTKLLGLIFVFPFSKMVGQQGTALYSYAYVPYALFLDLATIGIPLGMAKFVSKYNSLGQYKTSFKMLYQMIFFMTILGIFMCFIMVWLSPMYAKIVLGGEQKLSNNVQDVEFVIQVISLALIIIPIVSVIRGFFQGFQNVIPTTISQVVEQVVRVLFILISVFIVVKIYNNNDTVTAVSFAVFAAFISSIAALIVLMYFLRKNKKYFSYLKSQDTGFQSKKTFALFKELLYYAIPFAVFALNYVVYQFIDSVTFNSALLARGESEPEILFGIYTFDVQKLALLPVTIAIAFSSNIVPAITKSFHKKDYETVRSNIVASLQIIYFLVFPAVLGIMLFSDTIYNTLYTTNEYGASILFTFAPLALLFSFNSITMAILQGINKQKVLFRSLILGILLKLILNYTLIFHLGVNGAIVSTFAGFSLTIILNIIAIKKYTDLKLKYIYRRMLVISAISFIMLAIVYLLNKFILGKIFVYTNRIEAVIVLFITLIVGVAIYLLLSQSLGILELIFQRKINFKRFLRRRK